MITDKDIKKLKEVFDTKQESKKRHKETVTLIERNHQETEKRFDEVTKRLNGMDETLSDMTQALGAVFEWTDDIHRAVVGKFVKRPQPSS